MRNKPKGPKYLEFSKEAEVTNQATLSLQISVLRIRITLMRIRISRSCFSLWCGSGSYLSRGSGSYHSLFPDWTLQCSRMTLLGFHLFLWSGSCFSLLCGSRSSFPTWCGSGSRCQNDADPDPIHNAASNVKKNTLTIEILLIFFILGPPTRGWLIK